MNRESITDIKELITFLLSIRDRTLLENEDNARLINSFSIEDTYDKEEEEAIINNSFFFFFIICIFNAKTIYKFCIIFIF